jgi:hypothetical protein
MVDFPADIFMSGMYKYAFLLMAVCEVVPYVTTVNVIWSHYICRSGWNIFRLYEQFEYAFIPIHRRCVGLSRRVEPNPDQKYNR